MTEERDWVMTGDVIDLLGGCQALGRRAREEEAM